MKNKEVVEYFIRSNYKAKTKNLFIENNVLYSYGHHFPLCVKLFNGFIINENGYSKTTACHKGLLSYELTGLNFKNLEKQQNNFNNILLMNTEKINQILKNDIKTIEEVKNFFILKAL